MSKRTYKGQVFNERDRVQIHAATDDWMRGDRYGTVQKTTKGGAVVHVLMDRSNKLLARHASLWSHIA